MTNPTGPHHWIKASRSLAANACVELARVGEFVAIRDSKNLGIAPLHYTQAEFDAFVDGAKRGEFDHLLRDA